MTEETPGLSPRALRVARVAVYGLAAVSIALAARGDLWLDEVWSLTLALGAESWLDVVGLRHDNNHVLNTLFLRLLGDQPFPYLHRSLAVATGLGAVVAVGRSARIWGEAEEVVAVLLAATSYPLLVYFSEARGYAPAIFCLLVCLLLWRRLDERWTRPAVAGYWIASLFGMLAHSTALFGLAAFLVVDLARLAAGGSGVRWGRLLALHGPVALAGAAWYVYFVRPMVIGGGPETSVWAQAGKAARLLLGLPAAPRSAAAAALLVALALALAGGRLRRRRDPTWLLVPVVLAMPLAVLAVRRPDYVHPRYFLVGFPFFYLLLAFALARGLRSPHRRWRLSSLAVLLLLVAGQMPRVESLFADGRGSYGAALARIVAESRGRPATVGSDNDFRNGLLVEHYRRRLSEPAKLAYVPEPSWGRRPPDFFILHALGSRFDRREVPPTVTLGGSVRYELIEVYPSTELSGMHWALYGQRQPPGP